MDEILMDVILQDRDITKYVSFCEIDLQTKLGALHTNNIYNIDTKYEVLEGVKVYNVIDIDKERYWLRDYLLKVEVGGNKLFAAIE